MAKIMVTGNFYFVRANKHIGDVGGFTETYSTMKEARQAANRCARDGKYQFVWIVPYHTFKGSIRQHDFGVRSLAIKGLPHGLGKIAYQNKGLD